jgi:phosphohistidine phosphatase
VKRLHLLRHAKSAWDDPALDDHERPLAPRGRRATKQLARWLDEHEVRPELVLCSTAVRARQTLERVLHSLGAPEVLYLDGLYHASGPALVSRVRALPDAVDDVLLVGHNPGLAELALALAAESEERRRIAAKLPTGAFVTFELGVAAWAAAGEGSAAVASFVVPRELED